VIPAPLATAVTSISLEHTAILGDTIDLIAREKAGILKPGAPVVLGPLAPEGLRDAIRATGAVEPGAPVVLIGGWPFGGGGVANFVHVTTL